MRLARWIPTFLAFPLGGLAAIELIGGRHGVVAAAAGGALAGAVIGTAQWLALRPAGIDARWAGRTAAAMAAGTALAAALTGAGTTTADVVLGGLLTGAVVGAAQGGLLMRPASGTGAAGAHGLAGHGIILGWSATTAIAWAAGWLVTSSVIVDLDRGHHVFGSSGALLATLVTGAVLRRVLSAPRPVRAAATVPAV
jgi:hypothetical protein